MSAAADSAAAASAAPAAAPAAASSSSSPSTPAAAAAAAAGAAEAPPGTPSYASASLYVGDLHPDVAESQLFEKFNPLGAVASIRVCRDVATRRSLGYAYVNFHNVQDAKRALDALNNTPIKGRPMRIMWSQRDPSVRKSGVGNVFIKNLHKSVDHKSLHDTFAQFGNILSCKVSQDENGSKGFAFVHFETQEAANKAIEKVNGMMLANQQVYVGAFVPRKERLASSNASKFTNVYVKDLPDSWDNAKLAEAFGKFGAVTSCHLATAADGKSRCFGFVNYEKHEDAEAAVKEMNGQKLSGDDGKPLYAGRAQKKSERESELRQRFERLSIERAAKYQGINLYVKNLDDSVTDDTLRKEFQAFGTISSAKVMKDDKTNSKGFGFVCFSTPEEATRAANEMNGKMLNNKPLYVALAQRKEVRRAQLEAQYAARQKGMPPPGSMPPPMYPGAGAGPPVFYPPQQQFVYPQQMGMPRNRWPAQPQAGYQHMGGGYMVPMQQRQQPGPGAPQGQQRQHNGRVPSRRGGFRGPRGGGDMVQQQQQAQQQAQAAQAAATPAPADEMTLQQKLQTTAPEQHFNLVGETLYPLVEKVHHEFAGKITGMLLDRYSANFSELVAIMESDLLNAKINEAMEVLNEHQNSGTTD